MAIRILEKIDLKARKLLKIKTGHFMMSIDQENTKIVYVYALINKGSKYIKQNWQTLILPL